MKLNCWEAMQCGRQPGGEYVDEFGVCQAATEERLDGVNNGTNGGRSCWALPLTLCGNTSKSEFTEKFAVCLQCEFYFLVREEEGQEFALPGEIMEKIGWLDIHIIREQEIVLQETE